MIKTQQEIKTSILNFVARRPGCTPIELVCDIGFGENYAVDIPVLLEKLINDGSLIELEYELPTMTYRTKILLFAKDSNIDIANDGESIIISDGQFLSKILPLNTTIRINKQKGSLSL